MPELPEVEQFRRMLLSLVSPESSSASSASSSSPRTSSPSTGSGSALRPLTVELANNDGEKSPPRKWLTPEDVDTITGKFACVDVLRKGKLLCMVLQRVESKSDKNASMKSESKTRSSSTKYLFLHMGMTGRIAAPGVACKFAEGPSNDGSVFPPPYTYLLLRSGSHQVAFADSRKFGSALLRDSTAEMDALAPDALHTLLGVSSSSSSQQQRLVAAAILPKLAGQSTAIKPLLMDQKRAMSGVGNWVADEVLYQCEMHPDQTHLTVEQAASLCDKLRDILSTAVDRLKDDLDFPEEWLFHYRWTKKKASKDHMGRPLAFITSGGRTSAIVASVQKLKKQQSIGKKKAASAPRKVESSDENIDGDGPSEDDTATKVPAATKNPQRQTPMSRRRNADTPQHDDAHGRSSRRKL